MNELSIRIRIAEREYPMRVEAKDEERIRRAAKLLKEQIESYQKKFGLDDKQDLLAMVAFDRMVEHLHLEEAEGQGSSQALEQLQAMSRTIDEAL